MGKCKRKNIRAMMLAIIAGAALTAAGCGTNTTEGDEPAASSQQTENRSDGVSGTSDEKNAVSFVVPQETTAFRDLPAEATTLPIIVPTENLKDEYGLT